MSNSKAGHCNTPPAWHCKCNVCQQHDIELKDPRGRTPLHLAVTLGHLESTRVLLRHGADAGAENMGCWSGESLDLLCVHTVTQ